MPSLAGFADYLKAHRLTELVADYIGLIRTLDVPLLRTVVGLPEDKLRERVSVSLEDYLTALAQGKMLEHLDETLSRWQANQLPDVSASSITPEDLVLLNQARKRAMLRLLPEYAPALDEALGVIEELEALYGEALTRTIQVFTRLRDEQLAGYNEELQAQNEELQQQAEKVRIQQEELESRTDALRQSEERFRLLIENIEDYAIYMLDPQGRVTTWNRGAERLHGFCDAEILGRPYETFFLPEDASAGKPRRLMAEAIALGHVEDEGWRIRQDGVRFWADGVMTAIRNEQGELMGFAKVTRDLTQRRQAEEAQRQADLMKDQFISILSHELRTPVNAITGFGSILNDEIAGPLTPKQHEYVEKMLAGADALLSLINDLLDMSRIQAGKFQLIPGRVRLIDVVSDVCENMRPIADRKRLQLVNEVPGSLPFICADEQRLAQVLQNLLSNAIKFTPEGGTITLRAYVRGDRLVTEVSDTGIGIAREDEPKLFKPFTQLDMSNTRKVGGTGLGLSITKALVEAHEGQIGVRSQPGQGSTFWFSLPLEMPTLG